MEAGLARISSSNPYYIAYVVFGVLLFALLIAVRKWRGDRITWSIKGITMKKEDSSPLSKSEINLAVLKQIGNLCPACGAAAGAEASVCPRCGSTMPRTDPVMSQQQIPTDAAQESTGEARKCPSCGCPVANGMDACPQCNWRLRKPSTAVPGDQPLPCPSCGTLVSGSVPTCPQCNWHLSKPSGDAPRSEQVKCPSCGIMVATGAQTCPSCNWRLVKPETAGVESQPHIGVVRRDVIIGGAVAFKKDEWVNIESESPDPERPQYKYVVRSRALGKRYRLSDSDLSR